MALGDGSGDAFLHMKVLRQAGYDSLAEGAEIDREVSQGDRGLQVAAINAVNATAAPSQTEEATGVTVEGTVKSYLPNRGFGFIEHVTKLLSTL